ncbi:Hypothetical_protein [Hexamita inflata]|uniref:Hypothetical_protein n=1 Tax=Hexamita inflata TaxID=28002 RepID=A0AA86UID7_9EUKA|nr:Hypothetical protein HINF_LOCUS47115 [Hexamita inflata]
MTALWWSTRRSQEKPEKQMTVYPRTMLMYMNGANQLKQDKLQQAQYKLRLNQTQRSSYISANMTPSPGRYSQQHQTTNSSAYATKAERKIVLAQFDPNIPAPTQYQNNVEDLKIGTQVKMCGSNINRTARFIEKKTGPKLTTKQIALLDSNMKKEINYSVLEKSVKGGTMPREGLYSAKKAIIDSFVGPGCYDARYSVVGKPTTRSWSCK